MKVIHVTAALSRAGAGVSQAAWDLARETRGQGHDVRIIGVADEFTESDVGQDPGCPFVACQAAFPRGFGRCPEMAMVLGQEAEGADIIHSHGLWLYPGIAARKCADALRIPRIISMHGMLEPWAIRHHAQRKRIGWRLFERRNLQTSACLHATSELEAANVRAIGFTNPLAVIPLGINTAPYRSPRETSQVNKLRDEIGGRRMLLFFSRLHAVKGPDRLLEAWSRLAQHFPDWHLVLAGPDSDGYRAVLQEQTRRARLCRQVTFAGSAYGANKYALLAAADLFVLPSHSENFGLVVLEALAAGLPVLTTQGTPWADLVAHQCGWWVERDVGALAAGMEEAMSKPTATLRAMGRRGRHLAETRYAWPALAREMLSVYEWTRHGGQAPPCVLQGSQSFQVAVGETRWPMNSPQT